MSDQKNPNPFKFIDRNPHAPAIEYLKHLEKYKNIQIAAPYWTERGVNEIVSLLQSKTHVRIIIGNAEYRAFKVLEKAIIGGQIREEDVRIYLGRGSPSKPHEHSMYHGKLYMGTRGDDCCVFVGSFNPTDPGLNGGNGEAGSSWEGDLLQTYMQDASYHFNALWRDSVPWNPDLIEPIIQRGSRDLDNKKKKYRNDLPKNKIPQTQTIIIFATPEKSDPLPSRGDQIYINNIREIENIRKKNSTFHLYIIPPQYSQKTKIQLLEQMPHLPDINAFLVVLKGMDQDVHGLKATPKWEIDNGRLCFAEAIVPRIHQNTTWDWYLQIEARLTTHYRYYFTSLLEPDIVQIFAKHAGSQNAGFQFIDRKLEQTRPIIGLRSVPKKQKNKKFTPSSNNFILISPRREEIQTTFPMPLPMIPPHRKNNLDRFFFKMNPINFDHTCIS